MSKELLLHQQEHVNPLQIEEEKEDENKRMIYNNSIEQEIECPRCHDIMALSSEFDRLSYVCQECNLSLLLYSER
jgi:transposase-like protein